MYNAMKRLIEKKFYVSKEEIQAKLDVFHTCSRLTDEEYTELTALVNEVYEEKETDE